MSSLAIEAGVDSKTIASWKLNREKQLCWTILKTSISGIKLQAQPMELSFMVAIKYKNGATELRYCLGMISIR